MAYSYTWPAGLPQNPQSNFSESGGVLIIRSPMDAGPAKQRKRGNKPNVISVSFLMTNTQVSTFETFVKTTLKGTARFGFTHPRTLQILEVRIIPSGEGDLYNLSYAGPDRWDVTFSMEVLP